MPTEPGYDPYRMRRRRLLERARGCSAAALVTVLVVACGGGDLPQSERSDDVSDEAAASDTPLGGAEASDTPLGGNGPTIDQVAVDGVAIDAAATGVPFDRRLLGTNLPAWLGPERLRDADFQADALATGTTLVRLPGGSWSNAYDWRACEVADEAECGWPWAARPSDFAAFMVATGLPASWTVSINGTAQEAAAAVAFFNGEVGDPTPIGTDRNGVDWEDVGTWASLRADGGHPAPVPIELWEVGNEVYGGRPSEGGSECASYGWEYVWTCDGTTYVTGDADHDGYLAIREAMLAVDPGIEVGAVGVSDPASWNGWGNEVIEAAGDDLDFYVVHEYGFDSSPPPDAALRRSGELWPAALAGVTDSLGDGTPVAVSEYNLVSVVDSDDDRTMTQAMNALYLADTIGQLAMGGVDIANQWNVADGIHPNGTSYGLFSTDDGHRFPAFYAMETWSRAGSTLLEPVVDSTIRIYPTRHDDGRITIIAINTGDEASHDFIVSGVGAGAHASLTSVRAADPTADVMTRSDARDLGAADEPFVVELPAYSISAIEIAVR